MEVEVMAHDLNSVVYDFGRQLEAARGAARVMVDEVFLMKQHWWSVDKVLLELRPAFREMGKDDGH